MTAAAPADLQQVVGRDESDVNLETWGLIDDSAKSLKPTVREPQRRGCCQGRLRCWDVLVACLLVLAWAAQSFWMEIRLETKLKEIQTAAASRQWDSNSKAVQETRFPEASSSLKEVDSRLEAKLKEAESKLESKFKEAASKLESKFKEVETRLERTFQQLMLNSQASKIVQAQMEFPIRHIKMLTVEIMELRETRAAHENHIKMLLNAVSKMPNLAEPGLTAAARSPPVPQSAGVGKCIYSHMYPGTQARPTLESLAGTRACVVREDPLKIWRLGSVPATAPGTVGAIPKILWMTDKTIAISPRKRLLVSLWQSLNPDWELRFLDDSSAEDFMKKSLDSDGFRAYKSFPLGVMRADMLRYTLLRELGGVYVDIDTLPLGSINSWLEPFVAWGNETLPLAMENDVHFEQWALAAPPGRIFYIKVVEVITEQCRAVNFNIPRKDQNFVHAYSGPGVWTKAIVEAITGRKANCFRCAQEMLDRCPRPAAACHHAMIWNILDDARAYPNADSNPWTYRLGSIFNMYSSQWHDNADSWLKQRESLSR